MNEDEDPTRETPLEGARGPVSVRGLNAAGLFNLVEVPAEPAFGWTPPVAATLSEVLPGYEVIRVLGRGGMGAVYEARQINLERLVAVKLLPVQVIGEDPAFGDRFRREARMLSRLSHPNIVAVYDFGSTLAGDLFFTMELVDGETLSGRLRRSRPGQAESIALLRQVCEAVACAHDQEIVHRDLKPSNILISTEGRVKVVDFGVAVQQSRSASEKLTHSGMVVGTLDYLAPEQWQGVDASARSDIYSLGVVAYQLLTGEVPRGAFDPPSFRRASVDQGFDEVIMRALQMDPRRRYGGALEFRDALIAAHETSLLAGTSELVGESQARVLENFYENVISGLPETVRFFVEDKLLTPSGYRDSRALDDVLTSAGISRQSLDRLVEKRLLRIEERAGVPRVEISHDRLTGAIQASRDARRIREERNMAREKEAKLKRLQRQRLGLVATGALVMCVFLWGLWQHRVAEIRASNEASAREQVRALLETVEGPLFKKLQAMGKLSVLDPYYHTIDALFKEYPPSREDPEFAELRAAYLKNRGVSYAARGRREDAASSLRDGYLLYLETGHSLQALECALSAGENLSDQGHPNRSRKVLEEAAPLLPKGPAAPSGALRARWKRLMARASRGLRQWVQAVGESRAAIEILTALPPGHPGMVPGAFDRELALAESEHAGCLEETGDPADRLAHLRKAARLMEAAVQASPDSFEWSLEAAAATMSLATALRQSPEGFQIAEAALGRTAALVRRDPDNVYWYRAHALALGWRGLFHLDRAEIRDKPFEATVEFGLAELYSTQALDLSRRLVAEDPTIEAAQWDLAGLLLQTGDVNDLQNRPRESEPQFREALAVMTPFATSPDFPVPDRLYGLSVALSRLGGCLEHQGRGSAALAHYGEWESRALKEAGAQPVWRFLAADAARGRGNILQKSGDLAGAFAAYRQTLEQLSRLRRELPVEADPSPGWAWRNRLAAGLAKAVTAVLQPGPVSPPPPGVSAGEARAVATLALQVLFGEWSLDSFPAEDAAVRETLQKALTPP